MPVASIRGVNINYQIVGDRGPWVALSPGGRRDLGGVLPLAEVIAEAGYRVLIHDRRNCGASDVVIEGQESEYEIWADDLYELLSKLGALPAFVGGSSSGCRLSLLFALRHPEAVRALLLWRVTGGPFAVQRLAHNYYGQFIDAAKQGPRTWRSTSTSKRGTRSGKSWPRSSSTSSSACPRCRDDAPPYPLLACSAPRPRSARGTGATSSGRCSWSGPRSWSSIASPCRARMRESSSRCCLRMSSGPRSSRPAMMPRPCVRSCRRSSRRCATRSRRSVAPSKSSPVTP